MAEPEITDAELDALEARCAGDLSDFDGRRLIKALRACRQQSRAKDAVIQTAREVVTAYDEIIERRAAWKAVSWKRLRKSLAALDKLRSVAKQGETDDVRKD